MMAIQRPGHEPLEIEFILLDFEGTLATDGRVHPKAKDKINLLSKRTKIYIMTKSEGEKVGEALRKTKAEILYFKEGEAPQAKMKLLQQMKPQQTVVIGNGLDDVPIMERAGLAICVIGKEGSSSEAMAKADLIVTNVLDALDFLLKPLRQRATLSR